MAFTLRRSRPPASRDSLCLTAGSEQSLLMLAHAVALGHQYSITLFFSGMELSVTLCIANSHLSCSKKTCIDLIIQQIGRIFLIGYIY